MTVEQLVNRLMKMNPSERVIVRDSDGDLVEADDAQALTLAYDNFGLEPIVYISGS